MSRLFVAVRPPADVLDLLAALPRPAEPGVRYTTRAQWHVTLRFLGDADVASAVAALDDLEADRAEVVLGPRVSRLGQEVIVVPVAGLDEVAAAVNRATRSVGDPPDPRRFTGHLTVARLRRRGAGRIAGAPISAAFVAGDVELVQSHLEADGARYDVLADRPLRASR